MRHLLRWKLLFAVFVVILVIAAAANTKWFSNVYFSLVPYPEGIIALGTFEESDFDEMLRAKGLHLVLYFIESESSRGARVDLASKEISYGTGKHDDRFPCLVVNYDQSEAPRISSCASRSRAYDYERLDIDSRPLFDDRVMDGEIDSSKILKDGQNPLLEETYKPYVSTQFDENFLRVQKIGSNDFIAQCSGLQLTASDHIGAIIFYVTKDRPHARGALAVGDADADSHTHLTLSVHLKSSITTGYQCDASITLPSDLVVVLSGSQLLAIDPASMTFGVTALPATPLNLILFRSVH